MDETLDLLLNCTEKVFKAGGLAKFESMSSGCKFCDNMAVQFHRQKHVNSHRDAASDDDDGKQHEHD